DHDAHAFFEKLTRRLAPDAAAAAGYDCRSAFDAEIHVFSVYSTFTPAARTMSAHCRVSLPRNVANWSGDIVPATAETVVSISFTFGCSRPFMVSACSRLTMLRGVPLGAHNPEYSPRS